MFDEIVKISDECHELGYFDLESDNGKLQAIETIKESLVNFDDTETLDKLNKYLASVNTIWDVHYNDLKDILEDALTYIKIIDIVK